MLAALLSTACAAHEPAPRLHVPDEPAPAGVAGEGREVPSAAPELGETGAVEEPEAPAAVADDEGRVKQVESLAAAAYEEGKRAAMQSIAQNELAIETFGYPTACRREYSRILWEKYKVMLREVAGCVVDDTIIEHARGYNEVMEAEIMRRHGRNVFKKVSRRAGC